MLTMPLYFYPITLLWVDDDPLLLQACEQLFSKKYFNKSFQEAKKGLAFLKNYHSVSADLPVLLGCKEQEEYDLNDHAPVDINMRAITTLFENLERFHDVAILIVDYHMPEMTGVELSRELQHLAIKKILLTGEADAKQAVSAFNEGIIDRFLRKDDPELVNNLENYINILHKEYFNDLTKPLLKHLESDYLLPQSDPIFIHFFYEWCELNQIREYYLINTNGDLMTIDAKGNRRFFIIHTERTLNTFTEFYIDDITFSSLLTAVKNRDKVPFFGLSQEAWQIDVQEWNQHFYTPQALEGRERYWIAII